MEIKRLLQNYALNSEYMPLREVLLYKPGPEIQNIENPEEVLYINRVDHKIMDEEYSRIFETYDKLNIKYHLISPVKEGGVKKYFLFNLMYTRDLFFMTPKGAIMASMAHKVRQQEVKFAEQTLEEIGVPVIGTISKATFEGADGLWVNASLVIIGIGNRTDRQGFLQVKQELKKQGVDSISVPAPLNTQHLLGAVQFVDSNLALVRIKLANGKIINFLKQNKIEIVPMLEDEEVSRMQAMNIVVVAPRHIIMPSGCPKTRNTYERYGISVSAQIKISQLINGGGGLSCATAPIAR